MISKFYHSISQLKLGNEATIPYVAVIGTIENLGKIRRVPEPNRIEIKSRDEQNICFHCHEKIPVGELMKWASGSNEVLHLDCEAQYERIHDQPTELNEVREADFTDATGKIKLTLWKTDTHRFSNGDKIIVDGGYLYSFNKTTHISAGYFGNLSEIAITRSPQKTCVRNYSKANDSVQGLRYLHPLRILLQILGFEVVIK